MKNNPLGLAALSALAMALVACGVPAPLNTGSTPLNCGVWVFLALLVAIAVRWAWRRWKRG